MDAPWTRSVLQVERTVIVLRILGCGWDVIIVVCLTSGRCNDVDIDLK